MTRVVLAAAMAALVALPVTLPRSALAQGPETSYQERRAQLAKELEATQRALADAKGQRAQLQARLERLIAQAMEERAQALLLSDEQSALRELDALLATSQTNLNAQRERFAALADAVGARSGASLVVLLRADSSAVQAVESATVTVDSVTSPARSYTGAASDALARGAVDQLFRAPVVPTEHTVAVQVLVGGRPVTHSLTVNAARQSVTYVQFAVRNGQVTASTWTSRGTGPF